MRKYLISLCLATVATLLFSSCVDNDIYTIAVRCNNDDWGIVTGGGEYKKGTTVEQRATPRGEQYRFDGWTDGVSESVRTVVVTQDTTYTAHFTYLGDSTGTGTDTIPDPYVPPVADDDTTVYVMFDDEGWYASSSDLEYEPTSGSWRCVAYRTPLLADGSYTYPVVTAIFYNTTQGRTTYTLDTASLGYDNGFMRLEYTKNRQFDMFGAIHGDFWASRCQLTVTAFDPSTLTLSTKIEARMADIYSYYYGGTYDNGHLMTLRISNGKLQTVASHTF